VSYLRTTGNRKRDRSSYQLLTTSQSTVRDNDLIPRSGKASLTVVQDVWGAEAVSTYSVLGRRLSKHFLYPRHPLPEQKSRFLHVVTVCILDFDHPFRNKVLQGETRCLVQLFNLFTKKVVGRDHQITYYKAASVSVCLRARSGPEDAAWPYRG